MAESVAVIALVPVWYHLNGEHKTGDRFQMLVSDLDRHVKAKMVVVSDSSVEEQVDETTLEALLAKWDLKVTPGAYLKNFPNGPKSALALRIVEAEAEKEEADAAAKAAAEAAGSEEVPPVSTGSINLE